jgi:hypothetical protein
MGMATDRYRIGPDYVSVRPTQEGGGGGVGRGTGAVQGLGGKTAVVQGAGGEQMESRQFRLSPSMPEP